MALFGTRVHPRLENNVVENELDTFEDMNQSIDELKEIYEEISQDILKEETGWEQKKDKNYHNLKEK